MEAEGVGGPSEEAVQAKLAEYQNRVATEGELGEADVAELESMAPGQVKEEKEWRVCLLAYLLLVVAATCELSGAWHCELLYPLVPSFNLRYDDKAG